MTNQEKFKVGDKVVQIQNHDGRWYMNIGVVQEADFPKGQELIFVEFDEGTFLDSSGHVSSFVLPQRWWIPVEKLTQIKIKPAVHHDDLENWD